MFLCSKFKVFVLMAFTIFFGVSFVAAQGTNTAFSGETRKLKVSDRPGNSFFWKIFTDRNLTNEVSTTEAEFIDGKMGAEVTVRWNTNGTYYFTVQTVDFFGCSNLKVGKMEVMTSLVVANAGIDAFIGSCQQFTLDGSASKGDQNNYEWSAIDPGVTINNARSKLAQLTLSSSYMGDLPALFRIRLKVTNQSGETDTDTIVVGVDTKPLARIIYSDNMDINGHKIADGRTSAGSSIVYNWYAVNGIIDQDHTNPMVSVTVPGEYSLLVKDSYGCESTVTESVLGPQKIFKANPDFGRCSWAEVLIIPVISNDFSSDNNIVRESVRVTKKPSIGSAAVLNDGTIKYIPELKVSGRDKFGYKVCDGNNLCDSSEVTIDVYGATVIFPQGFSPNGDGFNDLFVFKGLENYPGSQLIVLNKEGQVCYKSDNYQNDWNGKMLVNIIGQKIQVAPGVYYYSLKFGGTDRVFNRFIYIAY